LTAGVPRSCCALCVMPSTKRCRPRSQRSQGGPGRRCVLCIGSSVRCWRVVRTRSGCQSIDCFEEHPFREAVWPSKKDKHRRFFMYQTIPRELGVSGKSIRGQHTPCVMREIHDRYGESSTVGFMRREGGVAEYDNAAHKCFCVQTACCQGSNNY